MRKAVMVGSCSTLAVAFIEIAMMTMMVVIPACHAPSFTRGLLQLR